MSEYVIQDPLKDGMKIAAVLAADPLNKLRLDIANRNFQAALNNGDLEAAARHFWEAVGCMDKAISTLQRDT